MIVEVKLSELSADDEAALSALDREADEASDGAIGMSDAIIQDIHALFESYKTPRVMVKLVIPQKEVDLNHIYIKP